MSWLVELPQVFGFVEVVSVLTIMPGTKELGCFEGHFHDVFVMKKLSTLECPMRNKEDVHVIVLVP